MFHFRRKIPYIIKCQDRWSNRSNFRAVENNDKDVYSTIYNQYIY